METRTVEQVENWNTRRFTDGYAGLRELSDGEFSGAVEAGGAWLFMLNGRIIGVFEGSLDNFESADGTAYAAPHPSLPLLFSMQEQGGETQAKYYTNDTPLSEVDSTLSSGKFTGFVELSENVLSGDYYVAYYGGRSMSVAFVGASEQVITGDDAFERAKDEVGIYEVRDVDVEVTDVPEPEGASDSADPPAGSRTESDAPDAGARSGTIDSPGGGSPDSADAATPEASAGADPSTEADASTDTDATAPTDASTATGTSAGADASTATDASASTDSASSARDSPATSDSQTGQTAASDSSDATDEQNASVTGSESSASTGTQTSETANAERTTDAERINDAERTADASGGAAVESSASSSASGSSRAEAVIDEAESEASAGRTTSDDSASEKSTESESDAFSEEAEWRETTTIPSLDPDRSAGPDEAESEASGNATGEGDRRAKTESKSASSGQSRSNQRAAESRQSQAQTNRTSKTQTSETSSSSATESETTSENSSQPSEEVQARVQKLRSQLRQRKQQVEQLQERLSKVESQRDEFERERDALSQEVERLEAKLERTGSAETSDAGRQLGESQAFDGTNLFVRYRSKGKATLDEAAEGTVEAEDVNANLQLEHHTQFDADGVTVDGEPFESFLTDSFEYRFVSWVIEDLLYEIRETGHRTGLKELYESIPKIDRVDLHGTVSAGTDDDTRQESFDVIMRDRMGNPLVVADLNGSREPTTGDMMGSLVDAASGVGEAYDELSGAFQVTESFFEPEALETTEAATSGGFLSREKRESFVKLSRKQGYHLCLVESRSGGFHLNVPEL